MIKLKLHRWHSNPLPAGLVLKCVTPASFSLTRHTVTGALHLHFLEVSMEAVGFLLGKRRLHPAFHLVSGGPWVPATSSARFWEHGALGASLPWLLPLPRATRLCSFRFRQYFSSPLCQNYLLLLLYLHLRELYLALVLELMVCMAACPRDSEDDR